MNTKTKEFLEELRELLAKYDVTIESGINHNLEFIVGDEEVEVMRLDIPELDKELNKLT